METIVVLVKQTFDTEEKVTVAAGKIMEQEVKYVINPYDEYALEEALRIKEIHGGKVIAITCGPNRSQEALRTALAVGADEAIQLDSQGLTDDSHLIAHALSSVIVPLSPSLLLAGLFAVDSGAGSVALQVAERLNLPHVSAAIKLTITGTEALVERDDEGDIETVSLQLPALITAQQGLNEPRYPSLPGIMKAKRKPLKVIHLNEISLDHLHATSGKYGIHAASSDGASSDSASCVEATKAVRTVQVELLPPPDRPEGKRLTGTAAEQATELIGLLRTEAKVLG